MAILNERTGEYLQPFFANYILGAYIKSVNPHAESVRPHAESVNPHADELIPHAD